MSQTKYIVSCGFARPWWIKAWPLNFHFQISTQIYIWLLLLTSKPFELDHTYLGQIKYRSGKMKLVTFGWPWPKATAVTLINKNLLVCRIKWEPLNQSLQNLVAILPTHGPSPSWCGSLLWLNVLFASNWGWRRREPFYLPYHEPALVIAWQGHKCSFLLGTSKRYPRPRYRPTGKCPLFRYETNG